MLGIEVSQSQGRTVLFFLSYYLFNGTGSNCVPLAGLELTEICHWPPKGVHFYTQPEGLVTVFRFYFKVAFFKIFFYFRACACMCMGD